MGLLSLFHKRGSWDPEGRSILPKTSRWQSRGFYPVFWLNFMLFLLLHCKAGCSGPRGHPRSLVLIQAHRGGSSPEKNGHRYLEPPTSHCKARWPCERYSLNSLGYRRKQKEVGGGGGVFYRWPYWTLTAFPSLPKRTSPFLVTRPGFWAPLISRGSPGGTELFSSEEP